MRSFLFLITMLAMVLPTGRARAVEIGEEVPVFVVSGTISPDSFGATYGCVVDYQRIPNPTDCGFRGSNLVTFAVNAATGGDTKHPVPRSYTVCTEDETLEVTVRDYIDQLGRSYARATLRTTITGTMARGKGHVYFTGSLEKTAESNLRVSENELMGQVLKSHLRCDDPRARALRPADSGSSAGTESGHVLKFVPSPIDGSSAYRAGGETGRGSLTPTR